jgi:hypothetical protein
MVRFSPRTLFLSVTLIAIGVGLIAYALHRESPPPETLYGVLKLAALVTSGAFIGAGVGAPLGRTGRGAAIGPLVVVALFLFLAQMGY